MSGEEIKTKLNGQSDYIETLINFSRKNYLMGADSKSEVNYVVAGHAYALLEVENLDLIKHGKQTVLKLFNP